MIAKVLSYVTDGTRLLVFHQPDFPEQGIQVPGGSVEPGESLAQAALREVSEESGLVELEVRAYLGCAEYHLQVDVGPPHLRHFFHLTHASASGSAARWRHPGSWRSGRAVWFELWWEPLQSARLDWEMDAYLEPLRREALGR